ncbi:MAG: hypothetical protein HGA45_44495, partial [Chloroflexales bacterium]|nr:hypothetical protein [Chloroflexales bacterium]
DPGRLSNAVARDALMARRDALVALRAAGELGADALAPVEAELEALGSPERTEEESYG